MSAREGLVVDNPGDPCIDLEKQQPDLEDRKISHASSHGDVDDGGNNSLQGILISNDHHHDMSTSKCSGALEAEQQCPPVEVQSPKKSATVLSRSSSYSHDECRVCQQEKDEALIELGCHCGGGLAKAHQSCITTWFSTRGSNKCEICQQAAANIMLTESQASYWVWRLDPAYGGRGIIPRRDRGCFSPLWVAFSILIGGLLLDVLISITLGVSALPVNVIIGVIVILGLATALRLALVFCHEWSLRIVVHQMAIDSVEKQCSRPRSISSERDR